MNQNLEAELSHISNEIADRVMAGATREELTPLVDRSVEIMEKMKKPVIEIRSVQDGVEDEPYFKGSEDEAREWVQKNPDFEVWFMIINGDGLIEEVGLEEFLRHA